MTSDSTRDEDLGRKRSLYEQWGVEEYFLHDPRKDYLEPALQGYRLVDSRYQKIAPEPDGSLLSRTTGLRLRREGNRLRLIDPATGASLPGLRSFGRKSGASVASWSLAEARRNSRGSDCPSNLRAQIHWAAAAQ